MGERVPWLQVRQLSLVRSPSGAVYLVADIRGKEGDMFEVFDVLLVDREHNRREMSFDADDTAEVVSVELATHFSLMQSFPQTRLIERL